MAGTARYRCHAKLNLTLEILGRRDDGYHSLASLVHSVSLADQLRVEPADRLECRVEGLELGCRENLVARAAELLRASAGVRAGARISVLKRIPIAAGLGGGSSDAACALVALDRLWATGLAGHELAGLAARLGSDVPFFLEGGACLLRGRGDELERLPPQPDQWVVLLVPAHNLANKTATLYGRLEPGDLSSGARTVAAAARLRARAGLADRDLLNGFERAARAAFPTLDDRWRAAEQRCRRPFHLSGAGPALFALAADRADARRQAGRLAALGERVYVARTVGAARAGRGR